MKTTNGLVAGAVFGTNLVERARGALDRFMPEAELEAMSDERLVQTYQAFVQARREGAAIASPWPAVMA